ncbi:DUF5821 family protein [Halobaculum sp. MBLA0147]|uniref:transcriptional regulator TbsP domain-containing protein n=1 Tax=Halobaculum sp. MBLA0147 TaxID=3079934 RepID=UPI0035239CF3
MTAETPTDLLTNLFTELEGETLLVDPSPALLDGLASLDTDVLPETVHALVQEEPLKDARDDFLTASSLADHVEADRLSLRVLAGAGETPLVVTADTLYTIVNNAALEPVAIPADDASVIGDVFGAYNDLFESAEQFDLRMPGRARALDRLETDVGTGTKEDFEAILESVTEVSDDTVDVVSLAILVAARNQALLYDISKWGEDTGVASKATFSRTKTNIEDIDLLDTEKVPIDVGRPRLRLLLDDADLTDADIEAFADVAEEKLADI